MTETKAATKMPQLLLSIDAKNEFLYREFSPLAMSNHERERERENENGVGRNQIINYVLQGVVWMCHDGGKRRPLSSSMSRVVAMLQNNDSRGCVSTRFGPVLSGRNTECDPYIVPIWFTLRERNIIYIDRID